MSIKFDGTYVKRGSTIIGNFKRKDELREGSSSGGNCLGNVKRTDEIREGSSSGGKCLCNIKRNGEIREGSSSGGKQLIKLDSAAKAVGTSIQGSTTALVWWFFGR